MQVIRGRDEAAARLKTAWPWLAVLAWPLVLAAANAKWLYDVPWNDGYIYLGAYLRLPAQVHNWPTLYYFTRLAYLLPGYLAYRLLPPELANWVLHLAYYYGFIVTLFALLRRQVGARAALFTALLVGGYSHFLQAIGWDYMDGVGGMYLLLAVWALSRSLASRRPWAWWLAAGLALGASLHTHLFTLALWPAVALYLVLTWPSPWSWRRLVAAGFWGAAGVVAVTGVLAVASKLLGGPFAFFMGNYDILHQFSGLSSNPWMLTPLADLLPTASWLMAPAVMAVLALAAAWGARAHWSVWRRTSVGAFILLYLAGLALMVLISTRPATPVLSSWFYTSYLIPFMALALGAVLAPALDRLSAPHWRALLAVLLVSVPGAILAEGPLTGVLLPVVAAAGGWVVLGGLLLAAGLVAVRRADFVALAGASLLFAVVNPFGPAPSVALMSRDVAARRDTFLKVVAGLQAIDSAWPGQRAWLWFNDQEDSAYQMLACALAACYHDVVSREFPDFRAFGLKNSSFYTLGPGRAVVLLSHQPNAPGAAAAAAASFVSAPSVLSVRTIAAGQQPFDMVFMFEPEQGWQAGGPPQVWMAFQPGVATIQPDGSFYADPQTGQPGFMAVGPYANLPPGQYAVNFWLTAPPNSEAGPVARLDVSVAVKPIDFVGSALLLRGTDLANAGAPQPFQLLFTSGSADNLLEFRVQTMDKIPLRLSRVQVKWIAPYVPSGPTP